MRHNLAKSLMFIATLILWIAHKVDDDFTGKTLYVPADPEHDIHASHLKVIGRLPDGSWHVKSPYSHIYGVRHEYLKTLKVVR